MKKTKRTLGLIKRQREIERELKTKKKCNLNDNCIVKFSKIHNYGVFALRDIKKNEKIIEYLGEKISKKESDKRDGKVNGHGGEVYFFSLNSKYDIDGAVGGNGAQYINHTCDPNAETLSEDNKIWIIALRKIKKNEEITYDYGFDFEDFEDHECHCRKKNCIGFIVDKKHWKKVRKKIGK